MLGQIFIWCWFFFIYHSFFKERSCSYFKYLQKVHIREGPAMHSRNSLYGTGWMRIQFCTFLFPQLTIHTVGLLPLVSFSFNLLHNRKHCANMIYELCYHHSPTAPSPYLMFYQTMSMEAISTRVWTIPVSQRQENAGFSLRVCQLLWQSVLFPQWVTSSPFLAFTAFAGHTSESSLN